MHTFLLGAMMMACFIAGLFFLRFWRDTQDRFFALFTAAFWMFGLSRLVLARSASPSEGPLAVYLTRLVAFGLILVAIIEKNRKP
ncbi:MAG TPA: DUF5985 family protein [Herpetosiphonaceae bacterium]